LSVRLAPPEDGRLEPEDGRLDRLPLYPPSRWPPLE
jgi:hypothetical protein